MTQYDIDAEFKRNLTEVKTIVMEYLQKCYSCRNDDQHMIHHIWHRYRWVNTETARRVRQKIQNDEGLFTAEPETQRARAAKQQWMEHEIKSI